MDGRRLTNSVWWAGRGLQAIVLLVAFWGANPARGQANARAAVDGASLPEVKLPSPPAAAPRMEPAKNIAASVENRGVERSFPQSLGDPSASIFPLTTNKPVSVPAATPPSTAVPIPAAPAPAVLTTTQPTTAPAVAAFEVQSIRPSSPAPGGTANGGKTPAPADNAPKAATATNSGWKSLGQMAGALAVVIGLIFVGRAAVRKFVPGAKASNGKGVIEVLARHPLAKNQMIVLVRIGSQIVALNQGKEKSESVLVISDPEEVARIIGQIEGKNPHSIQAGFNKLLANARMDLEETPVEEMDLKAMDAETLDEQLDEMAAAKRQLMELRQHVRSVRDRMAT